MKQDESVLILENIGHNVYNERNKKGMTRQQLSEELGFKKARIAQIEYVNYSLSVRELFAIAQYFSKDISYFLKSPILNNEPTPQTP